MKRLLVVGAYIVNEGHVLLIWHKNYRRWVPVGGEIEENELPEETLLREVKEETGLDVTIFPRREDKGCDDYAKALHRPFRMQLITVDQELEYIDFVYFCKAISFDVTIQEAEIRKFHWFKREELNPNNLAPHVKFLSEQALDFFSREESLYGSGEE